MLGCGGGCETAQVEVLGQRWGEGKGGVGARPRTQPQSRATSSTLTFTSPVRVRVGGRSRAHDHIRRHYRSHSGSRSRAYPNMQVASLGSIFTSRKMKEEKAMEAHERIYPYHRNNGCDAGNRSMGGAAAYQSFL